MGFIIFPWGGKTPFRRFKGRFSIKGPEISGIVLYLLEGEKSFLLSIREKDPGEEISTKGLMAVHHRGGRKDYFDRRASGNSLSGACLLASSEKRFRRGRKLRHQSKGGGGTRAYAGKKRRCLKSVLPARGGGG